MATQVSDALVSVNNLAVSIIPNTLKFTEGLGEQKIRAASTGGNSTESIYSNDVETNFSMVSFEIPATVENIAIAKTWKTNRARNVVQLMGSTPEGSVTRTFSQAAILNNYEVPLAAESNIAVEFKSQPAV